MQPLITEEGAIQRIPPADNNPPLSDATPEPVGVAAAGSSAEASRADHVHAHGDQGGDTQHTEVTALAAGFMSPAMLAALGTATQPSDATPEPVGAAAAGASAEASRADHVHAHGDQGGDTEHTEVTALAAGFMSPAQLATLTGLRSIEMPPETSATISGFYGRRPAASAVGGTLFGCCVVPPDFGTFVRVEAWIIPRSNQAARSFTVDTQRGTDGGALVATTGTQTITTDVVTATHRRLQFPNAAPAGLVAGDLLGLRFTNVDASTMDGIRFLLYYLPA